MLHHHIFSDFGGAVLGIFGVAFVRAVLTPEVAMDPECHSRIRQDSVFFFRTQCEAKFLTSAKFLTIYGL